MRAAEFIRASPFVFDPQADASKKKERKKSFIVLDFCMRVHCSLCLRHSDASASFKLNGSAPPFLCAPAYTLMAAMLAHGSGRNRCQVIRPTQRRRQSITHHAPRSPHQHPCAEIVTLCLNFVLHSSSSPRRWV